MGVINAENMLQFKSSDFLIARIKKRLASFDALDLIDEGDFPKHIKYVLEQLGCAVYKECEALSPVINGKAKLPDNFKTFWAAYKCKPSFESTTKSINEQRPWVFYTQTEITNDSGCKVKCECDEEKTKIVIRTFVNGEDQRVCSFKNPVLLRLSPNVKQLCEDDSLSLFCTAPDEITVEDGYIHAQFTNDSIYLQYYGLPMDENGLLMIPDNEDVEKAIEYYIYTQMFEEFYWNSTVPNIGTMLQDVRAQYDNKFLPAARYWARLPSFQKMVQSIRRSRSRRKFFYSPNDRTITR